MTDNLLTYEGSAVTRKIIAGWYSVTEKTLKKMHESRNIFLAPGLVCPKDVQRIFNALGTPKKYFRSSIPSRL